MKTLVAEQTLKQLAAFSSHNGPYLFIGPQHVGKFTTACELAKETVPIIITPEKNSIGIADIQELSRQLYLKSSTGRMVIINDAHTMTSEAQNAFLKTLEEPPEYATIVLITHELSNLLPTVRSRCQTIQFSLIDTVKIHAYLQKNYDLNAKLIVEIAEFSQGIPGLAINLAQDPVKFDTIKQQQLVVEQLFSADLYGRLLKTGELVENNEQILQLSAQHIRQRQRAHESNSVSRWQKLLEQLETSLRYEAAHVNKKFVLDNLVLTEKE